MLKDCQCGKKLVDFAPLFLRVVVGVIFLYHGYAKWQMGVEGFGGVLAGLGVPLPMIFAWVVVLVEVFGGLALILGFWTHWAAKLLAIDMLVAILLVHWSKGFMVSDGGYEFALLLLATTVYLMVYGPGKWTVMGIK